MQNKIPMKRLLCALFFVLNWWTAAQAQTPEPWSVPVMLGDRALRHPFAGGLNNPQVSAFDFNQDGLQDLFVFDRTGEVILPFVQTQDGISTEYAYRPEYARAFPQLKNWVLLRDYNRDGLPDIFAYSDIPGIDGIAVYTSRYHNSSWQFERYDFGPPFNLMQYPTNNGSTLQVYVSRIDYPAIDDIDGDGDLDVVTFDPGGSFVDFFPNQEVEQNLPPGTLSYVLDDNCWGGFYESGISSEVTFADNPGECVNIDGFDLAVTGRHAGSTLLTFDPDQDGDQDLVLGDISFDNLNLLYNGGDAGLAWMNAQDVQFPSADDPVQLPVFPAAFHVDVQQDGRKDLLVAPNESQNAEDQDVLWYYETSGPADAPEWTLRNKQFLVQDMIDLGTGAQPVFLDYNADGLLDLLVGNVSRYQADGGVDSRLFLYLNTGTPSDPAFTLVDDDFLSMSQFNQSSYAFAPALGDLDGDGDEDLLLGENFGTLFFVENTAGAGNPMQFSAVQADYMGIDVGLASTPLVADLDEDGLPDLLVGERTGNINFFRNVGTAQSPQFNPDPGAAGNTTAAGAINTRLPGFITGYSAPCLVETENGRRLLTGSERGDLLLYDDVAGQLYGTMPPVEDAGFEQLRVGSRTRPAVADLDGDGFLEMVVGNQRGGLQLYRTALRSDKTTSTRSNQQAILDVQVYPNPASDRIFISLPAKNDADQIQLTLFNGQGQVVRRAFAQNRPMELSVTGLVPGMYVLRVEAEWGTTVKKVYVGR